METEYVEIMPLSIEPPSEKKQPTRQGPSECLVCFRPAKCFHCGVASCKACKTFFRRMCTANDEATCRAGKKCFENKAEVKLRCQACRYQKCIEIGMNPLVLELTEEEKRAANFKKLMKRAAESSEDENMKKAEILELKSKEIILKNKIDMLTYLESKLNNFRMSAYNPFWMEFGSLEDMIKRDNQLCMTDRTGPMSGWPLKHEQIFVSPLPKKSGMRALPDDPSVFSKPFPPGFKNWMFCSIITNLEYAKTFEFFHKLKSNDQKILIRHVIIMCMNLQNAYFAVSRKTDRCLQPDGTETPLRDERHHPVSVMPFGPLIRCKIEPTEYILLKALCLCNPTVSGLSEYAQDIIVKERQIYADILLNHCLKSGSNGPSRFVELLGIIPILENQQRLQKDDHIFFIGPLVEKLGIFSQLMHDLYHN